MENPFLFHAGHPHLFAESFGLSGIGKHTNPGEYKTGNRGAPTVFREFIGLHAKRVQAGLRRRAYAGPELASLLPRWSVPRGRRYRRVLLSLLKSPPPVRMPSSALFSAAINSSWLRRERMRCDTCSAITAEVVVEGHHHHNRDYSEKENGAKDHHGRVSLLSQECACLIPDTSACPLCLFVMLLMAYFLYSLNDNMA